MHKSILTLLLLLITVPLAAAEWKLIWSDEFDKPGRPDPAKWGFEDGFSYNNEREYYTNRRENAHVENGMLVIQARKEHYKIPRGRIARPGQSNRGPRIRRVHFGKADDPRQGQLDLWPDRGLGETADRPRHLAGHLDLGRQYQAGRLARVRRD